jgi:hypothetical protein
MTVTRRARIDHEISVVRQLVAEVSTRISPQRLAEVDELLQHDEPNEALLGIAWDLAAAPDRISDSAVRTIRETVGDPNDLPPVFRESRGFGAGAP